jgi:hypothetical protein
MAFAVRACRFYDDRQFKQLMAAKPAAAAPDKPDPVQINNLYATHGKRKR